MHGKKRLWSGYYISQPNAWMIVFGADLGAAQGAWILCSHMTSDYFSALKGLSISSALPSPFLPAIRAFFCVRCHEENPTPDIKRALSLRRASLWCWEPVSSLLADCSVKLRGICPTHRPSADMLWFCILFLTGVFKGWAQGTITHEYSAGL